MHPKTSSWSMLQHSVGSAQSKTCVGDAREK